MENDTKGDRDQLLYEANSYYSVTELAQALDVSESTVSRWLRGKSRPKSFIADRLSRIVSQTDYSAEKGSDFRFVDLFAGIGGLRLPFERVGGTCVFSCERDSYAKKTYMRNFAGTDIITDDITELDADSVPDHEVLLAGFPCQPFSIAGVSKMTSLNRDHGFKDKTQGTLFFDLVRVIEAKRPQCVVLENVKNLRSHDKGRTFKIILSVLEQDLGYTVDHRIMDAQHWLPQRRERVVIVGFRDPILFDLSTLPVPEKGRVHLDSVLHRIDGTEPYLSHDENKYFDHNRQIVQDKYTLSDHLWKYLRQYAKKHRSLGHGFGFGLVQPDSIARTLSARYYKDGSEILVDQGVGRNPRRLTPRECARLMGFPDSFVIPVSDTRAYQQFGNAVAVPVFEHLARYLKPYFVGVERGANRESSNGHS